MADKMDDNIKKAKAYKDALDAVNTRIKNQEGFVSSLANEMGIAFSGFMTQTKKSQEQRLKEIKLINDAKKSIEGQKSAIAGTTSEILNLDGAFKNLSSSSDMFAKSLEGINTENLSKEFSSIEEVQLRMKELGNDASKLQGDQKSEFEELTKLHEDFHKNSREFLKDNEEAFTEWLDSSETIGDILDNLPLDSIADKMKLIEQLRNGELDAVEQILATDQMDEKSKKKLLGLTQKMTDSQETLGGLQSESANQMTAETGIRKNMWSMVKKNSDNAFKAIFDHMKETNQAFVDAQKNFGFIFDSSNVVQMTELTSKAAEFGMSTKDTLQMMGELGDGLSTIDQDYLMGITDKLVAVQKATGISSKETTTIANEMIRAGKSATDVEDAMENANKTAHMFGVNTKKVLQGVARNIDKMRQMGFQGGEESLTRMVATAERLRMNVDEVFNVAKRARTIEGAMDMASELQLAGGSFAAINPMDLLSAARKGPDELLKILSSMGDDIGTFNEETGVLDFDAIDADRLQMVADSTSLSLDSIQKMIQKNAQDNAKTDLLGLSGDIPEEATNFLNDMTNVKGGKIEMSDELTDLASSAGIDISNVDDLKDLSQADIKKLMEEKAMKEKTLAEQAKANQSFQESITAFKAAIMNMFTLFQPVIKVLTSFIQTLMKMPGPLKYVAAALIAFVAIAPKLGMALNGFKSMAAGGKGLLGKAKGMLGMGGGGKDKLAGTMDKAANPKLTSKAGKSQGGFFKGLADGIKKFSKVDYKDILKFGAALAIIGLAITGFMYALSVTGDPSLTQFVGAAASLLILGGAIFMLSKIDVDTKSILKMSFAMVIVGVAIMAFAVAAVMLSGGIDWVSVLLGVIILMVIIQMLVNIGQTLTGPQIVYLMIAAFALVLVGVALMAFGASMVLFAIATQMMQGMSFLWILEMGAALIVGSPMLLIGGLIGAIATPFLILAAVGIAAIALAGLLAGEVDWTAFSTMGSALMSLVPGLIGFAFAGLMFLNPILMLGMWLMIGTLAALAIVMIPLAETLGPAADGLDRMAEGLEKLNSAASNLDLDKLDMLRSLSWTMAIGAIGGGLMGDSIGKIAEALAKLSKAGEGGGGGGGRTAKIQVDLKLNGRDLQSIIIDDNEIVS